MLKSVEEYAKFVAISGFRNVNIGDIRGFSKLLRSDLSPDCEVQLFDADLIATWEHLYFSAVQAITAFKNNYNVSKSLAVETVLFASAQRQIQKAIELIGVTSKSTNVAILLISSKMESAKLGLEKAGVLLKKKPDDDVLDMSPDKTLRIRRFFNISDVEIEAASAKGKNEKTLVSLVIERMALLTTRL